MAALVGLVAVPLGGIALAEIRPEELLPGNCYQGGDAAAAAAVGCGTAGVAFGGVGSAGWFPDCPGRSWVGSAVGRT